MTSERLLYFFHNEYRSFIPPQKLSHLPETNFWLRPWFCLSCRLFPMKKFCLFTKYFCLLTRDVVTDDGYGRKSTNRLGAEVFDATFEDGAISWSNADILRGFQEYWMSVAMSPMIETTLIAMTISCRRPWSLYPALGQRRYNTHTTFLRQCCAENCRLIDSIDLCYCYELKLLTRT